MKNAILLSLNFFLYLSVFGQGPHVCSCYDGVYFTEEAFLKKQLDDSICTDFAINYVTVGNFQRVVMIENGVKKSYSKNSVYGYTYKGMHYRFQKKDKFFDESGFFYVKDTSGLLIYTQRSGGKYNSVLNFYYSTGATSKIKLLTVKNLEKDYPDSRFIESCERIVKGLTNQSEDNALASLKEINQLFRVVFG